MSNSRRRVAEFLTSEDGPTAVEYSVLIALVILLVVAVISAVGTKVSSTAATLESELPA